jgi:nifR3 family TIM-barrel protein
VKDGSNPANTLALPLAIGNVTLPNRVFLAPMSGVSDIAFRERAERAGAGMTVSEMVASAEFCKADRESAQRAAGSGLLHHVVQLAGREAFWMGEAARRAEALGAEIIDINMGCPAKKVTGGYSGSALMRDLDHALTLIRATVAAVSVPVTLKMRLGWDDAAINAPELARRAQDAGVQMITVHGRTRCQFYDGKADWGAIRQVKEGLSVPLVVNGDIRSLSEAATALELSGADAVMIGRGSYGRPWLAGAIAAEATGNSLPGPDSAIALTGYVLDHYRAMLSLYGAQSGLRHARKHLAWYLDAHTPSLTAEARHAVMICSEPARVEALLSAAFNEHAFPPLCMEEAA